MCARRPEGQYTRGKTAGNRLRRVDTYVALAMPSVLKDGSPLVVDLGFGARPWTTLEMAERWRRVNPRIRVLGVEIDRDRVEAALPHADAPAIDFRVGGFDLTSVLGQERARVVRCMNVLRQYEEAEVTRALARIGEAIEPGGLLIEGTCDPTGRMLAFDLYRAGNGGLRHEALVFGTNFRAAATPSAFRTIAPKRLIHRMLDEEPSRFFGDWERAATSAHALAERGRSRHWTHAAQLLRERGWPVDPRPTLLERGFLTIGHDLR